MVLTLLGLACFVGSPVVTAREAAAEPVYDSHSGSYYDLKVAPQLCGTGRCAIQWRGARKEATKHVYKGIQGRLAIIHSKHVHELLARHFKLNKPFLSPAWIGLRYWCLNRKLEWVNGSVLKKVRGNFMAWDRPWFRNENVRCGRGAGVYMPVAYLPSYRWQASGRNKGHFYYFVEYPAKTEAAGGSSG
ncbi:MAG: C-type lectin domain-containing protein [Kiloniellales bacterium]|nr:C-type lectin domain-containing protein [Kiloniellales bacterium]